jgi:uncharacterized repeat protein (TIGR04052 family)
MFRTRFAPGSAAAGCVAVLALALAHPAVARSDAPEVEIRFAARVGDQAAACGVRYQGVGKTDAAVRLQDFRVYVSNFRLIRADGGEERLALTPDGLWQGEEVALLDFEDATGNCNGNRATNDRVRGAAPHGDYVGLAFDIGVPVGLNHQDPTLALPPLNFSALTWPWRYGYKFTTIDLQTEAASGPGQTAAPAADTHGRAQGASGFSIHLGSVDCGTGSPRVAPESPCATPNRASIRLNRFDPLDQVVVFDLKALLADTDVTINAPGTASGCMSGDDDDCVGLMDRLGLTFREQPSKGQRFVRAETAQ